MNLCREFGGVRIILAHGRPLDECITVMKECPNVFADTAFMPVNNIVRLKDEGLITRVLWGTDFPVMRYFYDIPPEDYYAQKVIEAGNALGESDFTRITRDNFTAQKLQILKPPESRQKS